MNISNLSNQIEIAFWTGIVTLLRPRRFTRQTSFWFLSFLGLVALLLTAFTIVYKGPAPHSIGPNSAAVRMPYYSDRLENGQNNLLLILVDQANAAEPGLEGIWMLIQDPSGKNITFMPIYPAESKFSQDIEQVVGLEKVNGLSPKLKDALQRQGLWWDNYLVIDREILARLIQNAGGIDLGDGLLNENQVVGLLPIAHQDAKTALDLQARIAQGICQRFDSIVKNDNPEAIIDLLIGGASKQSVHSDLFSADLLESWNRLEKTGGLVCEFPTLIRR